MTAISKVTRDQIHEAWARLKFYRADIGTRTVEDVLTCLDIEFEPETAFEAEVRDMGDRLIRVEGDTMTKRNKWFG